MIYNITKNIHQSTLNFFKKVVKIFLKLNRNKICFSWDKLTSKIASSRILTTLYGKYGNTGQYQQFHSQELHGIKLLQRKTWQEKLSNSFPEINWQRKHTHTHTHSQENPGISGISPKLIQRYMSQKYLIISDNLRVC